MPGERELRDRPPHGTELAHGSYDQGPIVAGTGRRAAWCVTWSLRKERDDEEDDRHDRRDGDRARRSWRRVPRRRTGTSSSRARARGRATPKLKLSEEDGGIEVEFEVDQNRNGVRWTVTLFRNGTQVARRVRVTRGPSGSFEARFVTANRPGVDRFVAKATRAGERCSARASFA